MYECKLCGKSFDSVVSYAGHMSGHARVGKPRPLKPKNTVHKLNFCKVCNKPISPGASYCGNVCYQKYKRSLYIKSWLDGEISGYRETDHWNSVPDVIRNYLFEKYSNKCSLCGWGETNKFTGRIPLEVEHIDGNSKNNSPDNLTLLCPNCHSLTATYRGANRGHGRKKTWIPADS